MKSSALSKFTGAKAAGSAWRLKGSNAAVKLKSQLHTSAEPGPPVGCSATTNSMRSG